VGFHLDPKFNVQRSAVFWRLITVVVSIAILILRHAKRHLSLGFGTLLIVIMKDNEDIKTYYAHEELLKSELGLISVN